METYDLMLFRWINGHHTPFWDWVLWGASQPWSWIAVLVAAYAALLVRAKKSDVGGRYWWWILLAGIGLSFLVSDQVSVHCFKNVFNRLRPCHVLARVRMFRTECGGQYGFVSSHAANAFSVVSFLGLCAMRMPKVNKRGWLLFALLLLWAVVVGYSRPYLGKHYPGDVVGGALLGGGVGALVYWMASMILRRISEKDLQ
ncbi:MAG: phosphatase PAP2 family protein [Bacteroidales bacterium]|nr:phosphatase PAP2 family protein [Bacteroidales bacterium]